MDRTALITGASSGIGREFAEIFAREGWNLALVARGEERLNEVAARVASAHGVRALALPFDLCDADAPDRIARRMAAEGIRVDALVNNAGFGDNSPYLESDWERQRRMVELNVLALMRMSYLFGAEMRGRGAGRILNVASMAAFFSGPRMSVYYASKAFVLSFSQALALELRGSGVTVTALCPGPVRTHFEETARMKGSRMFALLFPQDARSVAEAGYRAMMKGRAIRCSGVPASLGNLIARLSPRGIAARGAAFIDGQMGENRSR